MRITVALDDDLLHEAQEFAVRSGRSLEAMIEDALRVHRLRLRDRTPVHLPTAGLGGLQPGVDLDDDAALLDVVEDEGADSDVHVRRREPLEP